MSAEGKKKRGESGQSNAKNSPFRLGGDGVHPAAQRGVMNMLGDLSKRMGKPQPGSAFDKTPNFVHESVKSGPPPKRQPKPNVYVFATRTAVRKFRKDNPGVSLRAAQEALL